MIESWRWFGPLDDITLAEVAQTGATGIVNALHEIPYGEVWPRAAIAARRAMIRSPGLGLDWLVVESLPVAEAIKTGEGDLSRLFANYRQSLANLAAEGIRIVCYNFMPLLDWTRTDLDVPVRGGATALRFDAVRMAAFELHRLGRAEAAADYPAGTVAAAGAWAQAAGEAAWEALLASIMAGLPGAYSRYSVAELRALLARYRGFDRAALRANLARFLAEVVPAAEDLGIRLCIHPDDPPRDILGLPRIVASGDDIARVLAAADSPANGLTLCTGSLGAGSPAEVPALAARFAPRIHFAHLRNVRGEPDGSFQESAHLEGDVDMAAVVRALIAEERRRAAAGREDAAIPFRPDHGHRIGADLGRASHPGYSLNGRMRGLAELRGLALGLAAG
ncbi:MAG: mannonate dehydratase [Rhodobacteraceae bacterium]|jgi:mannonate dehydratase|nr:mannonate dehydratase [Paracoccaceae bacterium]